MYQNFVEVMTKPDMFVYKEVYMRISLCGFKEKSVYF